MFCISDGQQKFIYSYKTLESLKLNSNKNISGSYLGLNLNNFKSSKKDFLPIFLKYKHNKEGKLSNFCKTKKNEVNQIKKKLFDKKVDILLNSAFDKSNNIRHYNSHKNFGKYYSNYLINKKGGKFNYDHSSSKKSNNNFKSKIKNIIMKNFNDFFPEKYINSRERTLTEVDKKRIISKKNKNVDSSKKLFKIKYLKTITNKEDENELNKKLNNKLLNKLLTIYSKTSKVKLINANKDKPKSNKYIDIGLNTLPYLKSTFD
jgi:hypothetical protein